MVRARDRVRLFYVRLFSFSNSWIKLSNLKVRNKENLFLIGWKGREG